MWPSCVTRKLEEDTQSGLMSLDQGSSTERAPSSAFPQRPNGSPSNMTSDQVKCGPRAVCGAKAWRAAGGLLEVNRKPGGKLPRQRHTPRTYHPAVCTAHRASVQALLLGKRTKGERLRSHGHPATLTMNPLRAWTLGRELGTSWNRF
jgi:hypothetical protein